MIRRIFLGCATAVLLSLVPATGSAETIALTAVLSGANEIPPNERPAKGSATLSYDTESRELTWTVDHEGLSGTLIGAHIHGPANASANAGILLPMDESQNPITGKLVLSEEQAGHLLAGNTYVNLHTEAHPGGEIRGQIVK